MAIDYKKTTAPLSTITYDTREIARNTGNIYESLVICSRRSNQISAELKDELNKKLQEFASYTDNLEEVFENREQIEISRFYERIPKANAIAMQEYAEDKIYSRNPSREQEEA